MTRALPAALQVYLMVSGNAPFLISSRVRLRPAGLRMTGRAANTPFHEDIVAPTPRLTAKMPGRVKETLLSSSGSVLRAALSHRPARMRVAPVDVENAHIRRLLHVVGDGRHGVRGERWLDAVGDDDVAQLVVVDQHHVRREVGFGQLRPHHLRHALQPTQPARAAQCAKGSGRLRGRSVPGGS